MPGATAVTHFCLPMFWEVKSPLRAASPWLRGHLAEFQCWDCQESPKQCPCIHLKTASGNYICLPTWRNLFIFVICTYKFSSVSGKESLKRLPEKIREQTLQWMTIFSLGCWDTDLILLPGPGTLPTTTLLALPQTPLCLPTHKCPTDNRGPKVVLSLCLEHTPSGPFQPTEVKAWITSSGRISVIYTTSRILTLAFFQ